MNTSQPLIILGAGASHDFVNPILRRWDSPPLTNQLVERDRLRHDLLEKYPEAKPLFSRVASKILSPDNLLSFEEVVGENENHQQLAALLFYLSEYFQDISYKNLSQESVNNYSALLDHIGKSPSGGANIITFNYDTLLERQFPPSRQFIAMNDYVADHHPIKLFKAHGSSDWFYIHRKSNLSRFSEITDGYTLLKRSPGYVGKNYFTQRMLDAEEGGEFHRIPAIAVPTTSTKSFVCPEEHVRGIELAMETASKILIIGWKANDSHLLTLMKERLTKKIPLFIVSGKRGGQEIVQKILAAAPSLEVAGTAKGFSAFMGSKLVDTFFES